MTSEADYRADFLAATGGEASIGTWNKAAALSIDVGNCSILQTGNNDNVGVALDGLTEVESGITSYTNQLTTAQTALTVAKDALADVDYTYEGTTYTSQADLIDAIETDLDGEEATVIEAAVDDAIEASNFDEATEDFTTATTNVATLEAKVDGLEDRKETIEEALIEQGVAEDVDEIDGYQADGYDKKIAGVVIGLPTLLIKTTGDTYTVGVAMTGAANNGKEYIQITKGDSTMAILGGTVEIAAH